MQQIRESIVHIAKFFLRRRLGLAGGLVMFTGSLFVYHSTVNHPVFGRWSRPFFGTIAGALVCSSLALVNSWRAGRRMRSVELPSWPSMAVDVGVLCWGAAYLLSTLDSHTNAVRVLLLDFFGSVMPAAALLEWVALVLFTGAAFGMAARVLGKNQTNALVAVATALGLILLAELGLRVKSAIAPATRGSGNDSAAWERRFVRLNREGFRDVEHAIAPTKGTRRLLVVGDSVGFGWGVNRTDQRFGEQLAKKLTERTGQKWEAINACECGAHTLNEVEFLKRTLVYHPDVVILLYVFNDIYYVGLGEIASHTLIGRSKLLQLFFKNSHLFQEMYCRARNLAYEKHWVRERESAYLNPSILSPHLHDIGRFVALAKQTGALVGVVPFSPEDARAGGSRHRSVFVQSALAEGIPVWPLTGGAFDGLSYSQLIVNPLDGHPNALANRRASEVTVDRLIKELAHQPGGTTPAGLNSL